MRRISAKQLLVALLSIWLACRAQAGANAGTARMDLDVSPVIVEVGPTDPLPELGIHTLHRRPAAPSRTDKINAAARWLKAAAGTSPIVIEIPDTGYTLHLTGDPQTLQQLKDAVNDIHPPGEAQVMFECQLFTMSTEAIQKTDAPLRKKLLAAMVPGSVSAESITSEERDAMIKGCTAHITAPRLMMFDGRSAYVLVSTDRAYVANVMKVPAKAPATQPSYEPEIGIVSSGVAVGVKANIRPQNKTVAVQMKTTMSKLLELNTANVDKDPKLHMQIPVVEMLRFDQLCTLSDGESMLCHGEREVVNGPTTQPVGDDVFFIITATIVQPKK
jgi:hypothetical protein